MRNATKYLQQLFIFVILLVSAVAGAQTTVNVTNTTLMSNFLPPGTVFGTLEPYGQEQLLKDMGYVQHGYMESSYWQLTFQCTTGGTNDTTHFFSSSTNSQAYPVGFFNGYPYKVMHQDGTILGTGNITSSTANTSTGMQFVLGTALSAGPTPGTNTANTDLIYIWVRTGTLADTIPSDILPFLTGTTSWSSDVSPASNNQDHSLLLTNGSLTLGIDQTNANAASTIAPSTPIVYINFNGSYNLTYKAKCPGTNTSISYTFGRIGSAAFVSGSDSLTCNASTGAGWTTFTHAFTASETGSQTQLSEIILSTTGTVNLQDVTVIEGSTLAGNTTAFRDAVVRQLQALKPGSLRFMQPPDWCTWVNDQEKPYGARRTCSLNPLVKNQFGSTIGYKDALDLCLFLHTDCWLTLGHYNQPADWATQMTWESTQGYITAFAAIGKRIWHEDGNEPWNSGAAGEQASGTGAVYGALSGAKMAAARGATGFNSTVQKLVMDSWAAGSQSYGPFSWSHKIMQVAPCTNGTQTTCPDVVDAAPYTLGQLNDISSGSTGVYTDEVAEIHDWDSVPVASLTTNQNSMLAMQSYMSSTFNIGTSIYEVSYSPNQGSAAPSQLQMNQISGSVGFALNTYEHTLLMRRDSLILAPINEFAFVDQPYNSGAGGTAMTPWTGQQYMAAGPAQLGSWVDVPRPIDIVMGLGNTAIGTNLTMLTCSQSGTPTFNYAGGQGGQIPANPSVALVETFCFTDGSNHFTILAFNNDAAATHVLNFSGVNAPVGTVTYTRFGGPVNSILDNNANMNIGNNATPAVVVAGSSSTLASNATDTLPIGSMTAYTFTNGGTPTAATPTFSPVAGTYTGTQNVTVSCSTGPTACYSLSITPATNGTTGCSAGTLYTSPVAISSTSTLHAICGGTGFLDGTAATAAYTINAGSVSINIAGHIGITGNVNPE